MNELEEIKEVLKTHKKYLKQKFYVDKLGIFGSFSKGEETSESDVDILVEINGPVGWEFFDLKDLLEENLHRNVDLVTLDSLKPLLRERILKEVIFI